MTRIVAIMLGLLTTAAVAAPVRPNVLFIFTDDHAQHALSCYGSQVNQTPHLDRLAAGGARFLNSFVTNSICTPTKTACRCSTGSTAAETTSPSECRRGVTTPA